MANVAFEDDDADFQQAKMLNDKYGNEIYKVLGEFVGFEKELGREYTVEQMKALTVLTGMALQKGYQIRIEEEKNG